MKLPNPNPHISVTMAILVTVIAPLAYLSAANSAAYAATGTPEYTGRELVNGLLMGRGAVVEAYPDLSPASLTDQEVPEPDRETSQALDAVLERMGDLDPAFFDRFQVGVTSGDHYAIREALEEASTLLWTAIADVARTDPDVGAHLPLLYKKPKPTEAHADAVLVLLVAVVLLLVYVLAIPLAPDSEETLAVEMWIDRIATTLST